MSLIAIFLGYFLFAMMSAYGYNANESYVTLLGNWGMLIMGAYFGGRTIEKLADMKGKKMKAKTNFPCDLNGQFYPMHCCRWHGGSFNGLDCLMKRWITQKSSN